MPNCKNLPNPARMDGVTAIITGCNVGLGKVTAQEFYKKGARVIMACRSLTKAQEALDDIKKQSEQEIAAAKKKCPKDEPDPKFGELIIKQLDLQSLASVRIFVEDILNTESKIQLLVNNAGVALCPKGQTEDGFEIQFGTNHLSHFLLTILLLPKLIASAPARIVILSSSAHDGPQIDFDDLNYERRSYSPMGAYQQSKLANILFCKELGKRLQNTGVTAYALHPGVIMTEGQRHMDAAFFRGAHFLMRTIGSLFMKTPLQGALTTIHCAISEEAKNETGLYYSDCKVVTPSVAARDEKAAQQLWEVSLKLVGVPEDPYPISTSM